MVPETLPLIPEILEPCRRKSVTPAPESRDHRRPDGPARGPAFLGRQQRFKGTVQGDVAGSVTAFMLFHMPRLCWTISMQVSRSNISHCQSLSAPPSVVTRYTVDRQGKLLKYGPRIATKISNRTFRYITASRKIWLFFGPVFGTER